MPQLAAGDFIQFNGVGAYTICLTPTFINFLAPIMMLVDDTYVPVRRRQTVDDIVDIYNF